MTSTNGAPITEGERQRRLRAWERGEIDPWTRPEPPLEPFLDVRFPATREGARTLRRLVGQSVRVRAAVEARIGNGKPVFAKPIIQRGHLVRFGRRLPLPRDVSGSLPRGRLNLPEINRALLHAGDFAISVIWRQPDPSVTPNATHHVHFVTQHGEFLWVEIGKEIFRDIERSRRDNPDVNLTYHLMQGSMYGLAGAVRLIHCVRLGYVPPFHLLFSEMT